MKWLMKYQIDNYKNKPLLDDGKKSKKQKNQKMGIEL